MGCLAQPAAAAAAAPRMGALAAAPRSDGVGRRQLSSRGGLHRGVPLRTGQQRCAGRSSAGRRVSAIMEPTVRPEPKELPKSKPLPRTAAPDEDEYVVRSRASLVQAPWKSLPAMYCEASERFGDFEALLDPHRPGAPALSFAQVGEAVRSFAVALRARGVQAGDRVALFAENSHRWLIADQGIMACGAADAVRGAKASAEELAYIFGHSDSSVLVVEDADTLQKLLPALNTSRTAVKFAILLWGEVPELEGAPCPLVSFEEHLQAGVSAAAENPQLASLPAIEPDELATICYTSGTTGQPKGVMLKHSNLLHQVANFRGVIDARPGNSLLCLLPSWHMYERSVEYYAASTGMRLVYTGVQRFKDDLTRFPPDYFVAVPLVFDVLYGAVQKKLAAASAVRQRLAAFFLAASALFVRAVERVEGLSLAAVRTPAESPLAAAAGFARAVLVAAALFPVHQLADKLVYAKVRTALGIRRGAISGGGSLPARVDEFFRIIGINLLSGYGLTETSPVLAVRRPEANLSGSVGPPLPGTELRVVDPESRKPLPVGERGVVQARGPQVMSGYYNDAESTAKAISDGGWFDTGDLGWITPVSPDPAARNVSGMLVLEGRLKDVIVLSNGENVEPVPLEEAAIASDYIAQAMIVGQDRRRLGALVVVNRELLDKEGVLEGSAQERSLIKGELDKHVGTMLRRLHCERLGDFAVINRPFSIDDGTLTGTLKMRRQVIAAKNADIIESLNLQ